MKVLDVFCGVGGLSWGFKEVGWDVVAGIDSWDEAVKVFKRVHPTAKVLQRDVTELSDRDVEKELKGVDVVVGGPPCQAFSTSGKRALDDVRALLVKEFVRFVKVLRPEAFAFENVKGFTSFAKGTLFEELMEEFLKMGYHVDAAVLDAANFSAPQRRERLIVVGSLTKRIALPKGNYVRRGTYWTFREATSDLPPLEAGRKATRYVSPPQNELQRFYRANVRKLTLHESPKYSKKLLELMRYVPEGKSAHDPDVFKQIPPEYRPTSGYKNTYKRIRWDEPAPTITRNFCVPSSANCIHPEQNRALTPREAARVQTFPDDYPFKGTRSDVRLMIGNAVPPLLSLGLALRIAGYYGTTLPDVSHKPWHELLNVKALLTPSSEEKTWQESLPKRTLKSFKSPSLFGF